MHIKSFNIEHYVIKIRLGPDLPRLNFPKLKSFKGFKPSSFSKVKKTFVEQSRDALTQIS